MHFILSKFYNINWRRQLLNQLQLEQAESYFAVSNATTGQYIQISLNALSTRAEPEFNIDSNIELITQSKEFLGLFESIQLVSLAKREEELFLPYAKESIII